MAAARLLAVDLGATRLKAGVVDPSTGDVRDFTTAPTRDATADEALATLAETCGPLVAAHGLRVAGVCVPGIVDAGRVLALPGKFPGITERDLAADIGDALGIDQVVVVNDAVAYGAGEARYGAGAGHDRAVIVTIGTGVGVCVLDHGRPIGSGPLGAGILGGQIPIGDPDEGPVDTNGVRGTIEARCAAETLLAYAADAGGDYGDVPSLYEAAERGDEAARAGIETYRHWLQRGLVALGHAHTPSVFVLGGGPMNSDTPVIVDLEKQVNAALWPGYTVSIRLAALGDDASLLGVAHLATTGAA